MLLLVTDSVDEAMAYIWTHAIDRFGLKKAAPPHPSVLLGERWHSAADFKRC